MTAVAIESPNQNSIPWWEGPVVKAMTERYPDIKVMPIPNAEKESAEGGPVWVALT